MSTPNKQLCGKLTIRKLVSDVAKTYDGLPQLFSLLIVYCRELGRHEYFGMILFLDPVPDPVPKF